MTWDYWLQSPHPVHKEGENKLHDLLKGTLWLGKSSNTNVFVCFLDLLISCICIYNSCLQTHQKRASDPITDGCKSPCGCWELHSGPLEEQSVLLTAEPSFQPPCLQFYNQTIYSVLKKKNKFKTVAWDKCLFITKSTSSNKEVIK